MTSPTVAALLKRREEITQALEAAIALEWLNSCTGPGCGHKVSVVLDQGSQAGGAREALVYLQQAAQSFLPEIIKQAQLVAANAVGKAKA